MILLDTQRAGPHEEQSDLPTQVVQLDHPRSRHFQVVGHQHLLHVYSFARSSVDSLSKRPPVPRRWSLLHRYQPRKAALSASLLQRRGIQGGVAQDLGNASCMVTIARHPLIGCLKLTHSWYLRPERG